jgi:signal transduction histidine kinase
VSEHAALHNGRVFVEERPGGGARFVIELPVEAS